ncbi:hypothetical protein SELMODRAFT_410383 [Selaginella moellendorffii]|uniref:Uncharacterized protein n=1 Tax=Selaginella moellendorffii TaxID=88036 RepID=D8REK5_SELML|nr:hypothetical protein SELMODRAFT_410383 [Selaginella moellendorffii]
MTSTVLAIFALFIVSLFSQSAAIQSPKAGSICPTAVFTFADSLSDGGNRDIEAGEKTLSGMYPYGVTYGRPIGRYSDGLVIPNFLIQKLHLENLGIPSLEFNGTEFVSLNCGYAGATMIKVENQPFSSPHIFSAQVNDFVRHRSKVVGEYGREDSYMVEIGGDDINFGVPLGGDQCHHSGRDPGPGRWNPQLVRTRSSRSTTCPAPIARQTIVSPSSSSLRGCTIEIAQLISYFNSQRQALAAELTQEYPGLTVYYFDWFAANTYMEEFGFTNSLQSCCGGGGKFNCDGDGLCGCAPVNHTDAVYTVCEHPSEYFTFDGIHYTEHFDKIMFDFIMARNYITPKVRCKYEGVVCSNPCPNMLGKIKGSDQFEGPSSSGGFDSGSALQDYPSGPCLPNLKNIAPLLYITI